VEEGVLISPADGVVKDIEVVENEFIGGKAVRIGIFLSIFNVHINRSPCDVKVADIRYKRGKFKDARDEEAGEVNEANSLFLVRLEEPIERLVVRQISGAVARRIVCGAKQSEELKAGQRFGMIKFGSRTELYFPEGMGWKPVVKLGDKVKAGETILVRYEQ
jgi:phosphatidylserine decarboxylase